MENFLVRVKAKFFECFLSHCPLFEWDPLKGLVTISMMSSNPCLCLPDIVPITENTNFVRFNEINQCLN